MESNFVYNHYDDEHLALKLNTDPDSKVDGANVGPTWVLSAPGGPHVGPINLVIAGFIEINRSAVSTANDIINGVICRIPNSIMEAFNERINDIMNTIQREIRLATFIVALTLFFYNAMGINQHQILLIPFSPVICSQS